MVERVTSAVELATLLAANVPPEWRGLPFSASAWLAQDGNIALRVDNDLAMFEWIEPGVYLGHTWFASRGKRALANGRAMLRAMFDHGASEIRGETPVAKPEAMLFARRLGFTYAGEAERPIGRVRLCSLLLT